MRDPDRRDASLDLTGHDFGALLAGVTALVEQEVAAARSGPVFERPPSPGEVDRRRPVRLAPLTHVQPQAAAAPHRVCLHTTRSPSAVPVQPLSSFASSSFVVSKVVRRFVVGARLTAGVTAA